MGHPFRGLSDGRFRALGGTTNAWGGQLLQFAPSGWRSASRTSNLEAAENSAAELETMAVFSARVAEFLESEGLSKVELDPRLLDRDPSFLAHMEDSYHHMGMARMGVSPTDGVVDVDLKVFGSGNLFEAGAATFRATGFSNPTLTAVALGLRLSKAIQEGRV